MSGAPVEAFDPYEAGAAEPPPVKPWAEIEQSKSYRGLTPEKQRAFRERYFNDYGLPNLRAKKPDASDEVVERLRRQFVDLDITGERNKPEFAKGALPDVDYRKGAGYQSLVGFERASNDEERRLALGKAYGQGNVFLDPGGRWIVKTPGGEKVAVEGSNSQPSQLVAGVEADLPEIVGGAVAGLAFPPSRLAPVAAQGWRAIAPTIMRGAERVAQSVPAGAGAAAGANLNDAYKALSGTYSASPGEMVGRPATAFVAGLFGDLGYRGVSAATKRYILDFYANSATQNEKDLATRALREGFLPTVGQARKESGGGALWRYAQGLSDFIFSGNRTVRETGNRAATQQKLLGYLDDLGVPQGNRVEFLSRVFEGDSDIARILDDVAMPEYQKVSALAKARSDAVDEATRLHDVEMGRLEQAAGATRQQDVRNITGGVEDVQRGLTTEAGMPPTAYPSGILAEEINQQILSRRTTLANLAAEQYERVWAASGMEGSTRALKDEAARHWEIIAKTADEQTSPRFSVQRQGQQEYEIRDGDEASLGRPVVASLDSLRGQVQRIIEAPEALPLQQLARLRTDFTNMAGDDLTPAPLKGAYRDFAQAITRTLDDMARGGDPAAQSLREVNEWYAHQIGRFDRLSMKRLATEAGEAGLKAEQFAGLVIDPRSPTTMFEMRDMLGPETFRRVAAQRFADLVESATDASTRQIDPGRFVQVMRPFLDKRDAGFVDEVWGPGAARAIERLYDDASLLKSVDPRTLVPGQFKQAVEAAENNQKLLDAYWSENFLGELRKGGKSMEAAVERLGDMATLGEIRQAKMHFDPLGQGTPEWRQLQQFAMQRLLARAVQTPSTTAEIGGRMEGRDFLATLRATGRDKLDEMFGKEMTADLFHLGETLLMVTQKGENPLAGALAAGTLMFHPINNLGWLGRTYLEGRLLNTPGFIRWLTLGLQGDSHAAGVVQGVTRLAAQQWAQQLAATQAEETPGPAPAAVVSNAMRAGAQIPRMSTQR